MCMEFEDKWVEFDGEELEQVNDFSTSAQEWKRRQNKKMSGFKL